MTESCGCHGGERPSAPGVTADGATAQMTVVEVLERWPRARAAMQELGVNHCCGAHLTLVEAAAVAGVPLERLLGAVDAAAGVPA